MTVAVPRGEGPVLLAATGCFFVTGLTFTGYVTFSSELSRTLELSASQLGLLMSAFTFAYGAVQLVSGAVTSAMRKRDILLLALAVMGLSSLLFGFVTQYYWLLLLRIVMGMGGALVVPAVTHILSERLAGPNLDRALGTFGSGWGLGTLFAFYALALVLPVAGYPWMMVGTAAVAALAAVPVILFVPAEERASSPQRSAALGSVFVSKKLNCLALVALAYMASYLAIATWIPVYLETKLATSTLQANLLTGVVGFSLVAGSFLGGWLAAVVGRFPVALSTTLLAFLLLVALPATTSEVLVAIIVVLVGWIGIAAFPALMSTVPHLVPSHQVGAASGYVNGLGVGAALVSPFIVGFALDLTSNFAMAFLAVAPLTLLGLFGVLVLRRDLGWRGSATVPARAP